MLGRKRPNTAEIAPEMPQTPHKLRILGIFQQNFDEMAKIGKYPKHDPARLVPNRWKPLDVRWKPPDFCWNPPGPFVRIR